MTMQRYSDQQVPTGESRFTFLPSETDKYNGTLSSQSRFSRRTSSFPLFQRGIWCNMQTFQKFRNISQNRSGAGDCPHRFILIISRQSLLWLLHLTIYGLLNPLTQMFYRTCMKKRDHFHYLYDANLLLIHYLVIENLEPKILSLKTENRKLKTETRWLFPRIYREVLILTNQLIL